MDNLRLVRRPLCSNRSNRHAAKSGDESNTESGSRIRVRSGPDTPLSRPIPERMVGLEPGRLSDGPCEMQLWRHDKNADIEIERENVKLAQFDLFSAKGFTIRDLVEHQLQRLTQPNAARFSGANSSQPSITNNTFTYNFGLQQYIEKGGSTLTVNFNNQRLASNVSNFTRSTHLALRRRLLNRF
jgi:hypothetical protein